MKKLIVLLLTAFAAAPAFADFCSTVYQPVCADAGAESDLFGNACQAKQYGFQARTGGALIEFRIGDQHREPLWVYTTNAKHIAQAKYNMENGIKQNPVFTVHDKTSCNASPWTFHLTLNSFSDMNIEVCDALPSYVEAHKDVWIKELNEKIPAKERPSLVKNYCPWGAVIIGVYEQ